MNMKSIVLNNIFANINEEHPGAEVKFGFCIGGGSDQSWYCAPYIYTVDGSIFPRVGVASGYVEEYDQFDGYEDDEYDGYCDEDDMNDIALDIIDLYGHGFSLDEIANELDVPVGWVAFTIANQSELY